MDLNYHIDRMISKIFAWTLSKRGNYRSYFGKWRLDFRTFEQAGIHVLPVHYYSPVPDTQNLTDNFFQVRSKMPGVRINLHVAEELLSKISAFKKEYESFPSSHPNPQVFSYAGAPYCSGEAEVLYGIIRSFKPRKIIEIGSGFTTLLSAAAKVANSQDDAGQECEFISIDPYPPEFVSNLPGLNKLIKKPVQEVELALFESLGTDDILFIDSSHVVRTGSDVVYEYLEILPRIAPGVLVHIHDIFLPAEYPPDWIREALFFWNEQYLLQAILAHGSSWQVIWPGHLMHLDHSDELKAAFPAYHESKCRPSCWWMRKS